MKKFYFVFWLSLVVSNLAAQSKKEVIETLTFKIDSLNNVLSSLRIESNSEIESKEEEIVALSSEIAKLKSETLQQEFFIDSLKQMNLELVDRIQIANGQIKMLNDSISELKKVITSDKVLVSGRVANAFDKVKSKWSYFMNAYSVEECVILDSLNRICDDERCVSFLLTNNFLIVSYEVKEVAECDTQIINLDSGKEVLNEGENNIYVEVYDKENHILLISSQGYDNNGHFWQEGTFNLGDNSIFLGRKSY